MHDNLRVEGVLALRLGSAATAAVLQGTFRIRKKVIPSDNVKPKHAGHLTNLCIDQIDADLKVTLEEILGNDFRMTLRNQ